MRISQCGNDCIVCAQDFNNFREREKQKMDDEDMLFSPFANIQKSAVLQEAKHVFNDPNEVRQHPERCSQILCKLLFLLAQVRSFL